MKVLDSILLFQVISLATAGVIVPTAEIIEGPSSKTTLVGPDGSVITSVAQGAKIVADGQSTLVAGPDTAALLKSADQPVALETNLHPVLSAPSEIVESHVITPAVAPVIASKSTISQHSQIVDHGHKTLIVAHAPIIEAKTSLVSGHLQPVIASHSVPVVVKNEALVASKTSISEQSQTIVHPEPQAKSVLAIHAPIIEAKAAIVKTEPVVAVETKPAILHHQIEPLFAAHTAPVIPVIHTKAALVHSHLEPTVAFHTAPVVPVIHTKAAVIQSHLEPAIAVHAAPVVHTKAALVQSHLEPVVAAHSVPVIQPVISAKTTVSEHSQSIAHPAKLVKSEAVVAPEVLPLASVVGAKTTVTGHSQSIIHPGRDIKVQPLIAVNAVPVVAKQLHHLPLVATHAVPVVSSKTTVSENAQTVVSHSW